MNEKERRQITLRQHTCMLVGDNDRFKSGQTSL